MLWSRISKLTRQNGGGCELFDNVAMVCLTMPYKEVAAPNRAAEIGSRLRAVLSDVALAVVFVVSISPLCHRRRYDVLRAYRENFISWYQMESLYVLSQWSWLELFQIIKRLVDRNLFMDVI